MQACTIMNLSDDTVRFFESELAMFAEIDRLYHSGRLSLDVIENDLYLAVVNKVPYIEATEDYCFILERDGNILNGPGRGTSLLKHEWSGGLESEPHSIYRIMEGIDLCLCLIAKRLPNLMPRSAIWGHC